MLTAKRIARLGVGRYLDGGDLGRGLYLSIPAKKQDGKIIDPPTPAGGSWLLRYERDGRERWMGLGSLADFTLKEARDRARAARQLLADGIDPLDKKREQKAAKAVASIKQITFREAAKTSSTSISRVGRIRGIASSGPVLSKPTSIRSLAG